MDEVGACTAVNLDGGGSSVMWLRDRIVNQPSDLVERGVANHIAVVAAEDYRGCEVTPADEASSIDAEPADDEAKADDPAGR
jgi:hypothetical protein